MIHHEGFLLSEWNVVTSDVDDGLPMAFLHGWLLKLENDRKDLLVVFNLLLELGVGLPSFEILGESNTLLLELLDVVHPVGDHVDVDFRPKHVSPVVKGIKNLGVKLVQLGKVPELVVNLYEFGVLLMRETEEGFTVLIDVELTLLHLVTFGEIFKTVLSLRGIDVRHHRSFSGVLVMETMDISNELCHVLDELLEEVSLHIFEIFLLVLSHLNKLSPVHL
jgi:hypothetical protein